MPPFNGYAPNSSKNQQLPISKEVFQGILSKFSNSGNAYLESYYRFPTSNYILGKWQLKYLKAKKKKKKF